jgi:hypothetical protein
MLVALLVVAAFARKLGFAGVLGGMALAQLLGTIFMTYAIARTFHLFRPWTLFEDAVRTAVVAVVIILVGAVGMRVPLPAFAPRTVAWVRVLLVFTAAGIALVPALLLAKVIDAEERQTLLRALVPRQFRRA